MFVALIVYRAGIRKWVRAVVARDEQGGRLKGRLKGLSQEKEQKSRVG